MSRRAVSVFDIFDLIRTRLNNSARVRGAVINASPAETKDGSWRLSVITNDGGVFLVTIQRVAKAEES